MSQIANETTFQDRRSSAGGATPPGFERRQFTNSHEALSPNARELAVAIDEYKVRHRRRFITYEEIMTIIQDLGYRKD